MENRHKILLLDDDADWLALCRDVLAGLPSKPEIFTAGNAKRALALLETEKIRLLISDLKMPRIDGLQMISIVRRRFPETRTVVLSGMEEEDYRSRAYALGVDLFWIKPEMQRNTKLFLECIESLLGQGDSGGDTGFRGLQSKSLMDIIQMECLSRTSTVLRVTRGPLVAKLWIQDGELIDAECEGARGEAAFRRLLAWKTGTFENLPAEPGRERTIQKPVNALLLESAQSSTKRQIPAPNRNRLKAICTAKPCGSWRNSPAKARSLWWSRRWRAAAVNRRRWARKVWRRSRSGRSRPRKLPAGWAIAWKPARSCMSAAQSLERHVVMLPRGDCAFLVGWPAEAIR